MILDQNSLYSDVCVYTCVCVCVLHMNIEYWLRIVLLLMIAHQEGLCVYMKMHTNTDTRNHYDDSDSESTYEPSEYTPESDVLLELTKRGSGGAHPTRPGLDPSEYWPESDVGEQYTCTDARNHYHNSDSESTYEPSEYTPESDVLLELTKRGSGGAQPTRPVLDPSEYWPESDVGEQYTKKRGRSRAVIEAAAAEHINKQLRANRVCNVNPYMSTPCNVNPRPTPPISSQQQPTPSQAKRNTIYLEAACRVELLLAHRPPPAHCPEGTFGALLWRLCVTADTSIVPGELRKFASHCGGVPPSAKLKAFNDTPMLADPGNYCYAAVVARLLRHVAEHEPEAYASLPHWGAQMLRKMGSEKVGDVCEAVLAAANAAADREQGRSHQWETLRGGAAPAADASVPLLVRLISWQTMRQ